MAKEDKLDYSGLQTKDYNTLLDVVRKLILIVQVQTGKLQIF